MPNSVLLTGIVEIVLIFITLFLLIQPDWIFHPDKENLRKMAYWGGIFFLAVTFCWSVAFGIILAMNGISVQV